MRDKRQEVREAVNKLRGEETGLRTLLGAPIGRPMLSHSWTNGRPHFMERLDVASGAEVAEEVIQACARLAELEKARPYLEALLGQAERGE